MLDNFAQRQYNSILLISVPGCSAVGSVLGSGPRGREFKSRHSDQKKACNFNGYRLFAFLGDVALRAGHPQNTLNAFNSIEKRRVSPTSEGCEDRGRSGLRGVSFAWCVRIGHAVFSAVLPLRADLRRCFRHCLPALLQEDIRLQKLRT